MKPAIQDPAIRHLIIKNLENKEEGLLKVKQLKDIGITYICGAYEVGNNNDRHAHFLIHSLYDRRYIEAHKPFSNPFRMPKNKQTKQTAIPPVEISDVISYILKNGESYEYNDNQQYHIIDNYDALQQEAIDQHKEALLPATEKLILHFRYNKIKILGDAQHFRDKHKRIVKELLAFSRNKHKLIDPTIIFKQSCTILNDLEPRMLEQKLWDSIKYKFEY